MAVLPALVGSVWYATDEPSVLYPAEHASGAINEVVGAVGAGVRLASAACAGAKTAPSPMAVPPSVRTMRRMKSGRKMRGVLGKRGSRGLVTLWAVRAS